MTRRLGSDEVEEIATCWVARVDHGALTRAEHAALQKWLESDPRHFGAYARARATFAYLQEVGEVIGAGSVPVRARRTVLFGGGLAITGLAIIGTNLVRHSNIFETRKGEVRLISLNDGSSVTLNTASKIRVNYSPEERRVDLLFGEALFDIVPASHRSFVVRAGRAKISASYTRFTVRHERNQPIRVLVQRGSAEMIVGDVAERQAILEANTQAVAAGSFGIETSTRAPQEVSRALAWREGILAFEDVPLEDAIAEFARYAEPPIFIEDKSVGELTVTGAFSSSDPVGFAKTVASVFGLGVNVRRDRIDLHR